MQWGRTTPFLCKGRLTPKYLHVWETQVRKMEERMVVSGVFDDYGQDKNTTTTAMMTNIERAEYTRSIDSEGGKDFAIENVAHTPPDMIMYG